VRKSFKGVNQILMLSSGKKLILAADIGHIWAHLPERKANFFTLHIFCMEL
jgi:hypothetical protein